MDDSDGKKRYKTYGEAEKAAKVMRTRENENFQVLKVDGGWVVGGVHINNKTPYKREKVRSLEDIRSLFDNVADSISDADVVEYANTIDTEAVSKVSEVNGCGENWKLQSWAVVSGRQLQMANDTSYLVLTVESNERELRIQMGGAFARHIPLISAQAESLRGRSIVWHTWNSARQPTRWERSKWFYLIESVDG